MSDELRERTQRRLEALRRHRREVARETIEERKRRQLIRAEQIAHAITGGRVTKGIVKSMLALVVADEHPDPDGDLPGGVAPGARQVIKPRVPKQPKPPKPKPKPEQEGLW